MSEQRASTNDPRGAAVRQVLTKVASGIGKTCTEAAQQALASRQKPANDAVPERLTAKSRELMKKLTSRGQTEPAPWWKRATMKMPDRKSSGEAAGGRNVSPAITVVSAVITVATAAITFARTRDRLKRIAASRDSEPHGLAKSVDTALELIERALTADEQHDRMMRPRARRQRSRSQHAARRR